MDYKAFPIPEKASTSIPIDVLLLPQIIQRLHNEHSLLTAPYMVNSAELMMKLGYSARVLCEGFNNKDLSKNNLDTLRFQIKFKCNQTRGFIV